MKTITSSLIFATSLAFIPGAFSADYKGADAVLKNIATQQEAEKTQPSAPGNVDSGSKIKKDLKAYQETAAMLPPDEAAKGWLDLATRFLKLSSIHTAPTMIDGRYIPSEIENMRFKEVVASLPPPAAWDALAKEVEARPIPVDDGSTFQSLLLRLLAHRLTNNTAALKKDADLLQAYLKKSKGADQSSVNELVTRLQSVLLQDSDNGAEILKDLNRQLEAIQKASPRAGLESPEIQVPDLVTLVGEEKSAEFLIRALKANVLIMIENGDDTKDLAQKLALQNVATMKVPQWQLAYSVEATALYSSMEKQFAAKTLPASMTGMTAEYRQEARTYYLLGLIAAGRTKEATDLATKLGEIDSITLPNEGIDALEASGRTQELVDFFKALLSKNPDLPYWDKYIDLAVKAGQEKEMVKLAETAAARDGMKESQKEVIQEQLGTVYLAVDRVDEGIAILRKEIERARKQTDNRKSDKLGELGLKLANLGIALKNKELTDEGIKIVRDSLATAPSETRNYDQYEWRSHEKELAGLLIQLDRGPEAEAFLEQALIRAQSSTDNSSTQQYLSLLAALYHRADRPADVLALFDHAPQWGARDISSLLNGSVYIDRNPEFTAYFAASALASQGRKAEARKILDAFMAQRGDYDPSFELLLKLAPKEEALAQLDALYARDKYEGRPLIWKAKLLLDSGKAEEAEAVARQAVTVDPSDGHKGPGRRMRVYAVLADIREARGDKKEAEFLRGAVTAIRHSEDADVLYEAGLVTRAVAGYEESLTHFEDAYCIQSRLALRKAELGDMAGAEEHYRRAYELMPGSFGRVESHCFGCERAFAGPWAQSIAEKVFNDLAKKTPQKPQVHYLLGYLRKEQDRFREALPEFREAVRLDPEYLNAWSKLEETAKNMRLPVAERDAIQLNLLRLDPLGRHVSFDVHNVADLKAAWAGLEAAARLQPAKPGNLYPLAASSDEIEKQLKAAQANHSINGYSSTDSDTGDNRKDPGYVISTNDLISFVCEMLSYGEGFSQMGVSE